MEGESHESTPPTQELTNTGVAQITHTLQLLPERKGSGADSDAGLLRAGAEPSTGQRVAVETRRRRTVRGGREGGELGAYEKPPFAGTSPTLIVLLVSQLGKANTARGAGAAPLWQMKAGRLSVTTGPAAPNPPRAACFSSNYGGGGGGAP